MTKRQTPYAFFYEHAGYSYDPKAETKAQGRSRCARALADAEKWAREAGCYYDWSIDPLASSADWIEDGLDGDPYRRVIEAQLALEVQAQAERGEECGE